MRAALETERLSDFDHPLEALEGCHAYFEEQVLWLRELAARSQAQTCDDSMAERRGVAAQTAPCLCGA